MKRGERKRGGGTAEKGAVTSNMYVRLRNTDIRTRGLCRGGHEGGGGLELGSCGNGQSTTYGVREGKRKKGSGRWTMMMR